ncbi:MAG: zinc finger protein [Pseudonocardiaceae bacterium]
MERCQGCRSCPTCTRIHEHLTGFPAGQRHAIDRRDRNVLGTPMRCLCGVTHPRGTDGDREWLWPTCEQC